jgi:hypothetical protein
MHLEILGLPKATQLDHPHAWIYGLLRSHVAWRAASDLPNLVEPDTSWFLEDQDIVNIAVYQFHLEDYVANCSIGDPRTVDLLGTQWTLEAL